jgi:hypothetical protein
MVVKHPLINEMAEKKILEYIHLGTYSYIPGKLKMRQNSLWLV